jgi:hypothetical protein
MKLHVEIQSQRVPDFARTRKPAAYDGHHDRRPIGRADESGQGAFSAAPEIVELSSIPLSGSLAEEDDCKSSIPGCRGFARIAFGGRSASPAWEPSAWRPAHRRAVLATSAIVALDCRAAGCRCGMTSVAPRRRRTVAPGTRTGSCCATGFRRRMNHVRYGDSLPHYPGSPIVRRWTVPAQA